MDGLEGIFARHDETEIENIQQGVKDYKKEVRQRGENIVTRERTQKQTKKMGPRTVSQSLRPVS